MKFAQGAVWLVCSVALHQACSANQLAPTAVALAAAAPAAGPVGTTVTLEGSGFLPSGNVVKFGPGYLSDLPSPDGRTLRFVVPEGHSLCRPAALGATEPCAAGAFPRVQPGSYPISIVTRGGTSGDILFTVTER